MNDKKYIEDSIGFIELVDRSQQDVGLKIVNAARVSYNKSSETFSDKDQKLVKYLWDHEHTSPYRHTWYTFLLKCPLFVFRQWIKYQIGCYWTTFEVNGDPISLETYNLIFDTEKGCSWNEVSGRYVNIPREYYVPSIIRGNPPHGNKQSSEVLDWPPEKHKAAKQIIIDSSEESFKRYDSLIELGVAREIARSVLPQNVYTQAYWTVSLQSVLHFLSQRLKKDAQYEIRMYAECMYNLLHKELEQIGFSKEKLC